MLSACRSLGTTSTFAAKGPTAVSEMAQYVAYLVNAGTCQSFVTALFRLTVSVMVIAWLFK